MADAPRRMSVAAALIKAYHQVADYPPVLVDPLALRIVGIGAAVMNEFGQDDYGRRQRRLFFAGRARYAEDVIAAAVTEGTTQVVILGAGLDTFGLRNPYPGLQVFEVDQTADQQWKLQRLADAGIAVPASIHFVPFDPAARDFAESLARADFARDQTTVFIALGVAVYLRRGTAMGMLKFVAGLSAPVHLVVDYLEPPLHSSTRDVRARLQQVQTDLVAQHGTPWRNFYRPSEIAAEMRSVGLNLVEDLTGPALLNRYGHPLGTNSDVFDRHVLHVRRR